jgi:putrescine transport system substrate-binding protein
MADPHQPPPKAWLRGGSVRLAGILSVVVLLAWGTYILLAPTPIATPKGQPAAPTLDAPIAENAMRVMAHRGAIADDILQHFRDNGGLSVVLDEFDHPDEVSALIDRNGVGHDAVLVSGLVLSRLLVRNQLAPVNMLGMVNAAHIDPALLSAGASYDDGNRHSIPYQWGALGLAYNSAAVSTRISDIAGLSSWRGLMDPEFAGQLAGCGIQVTDLPAHSFPIALAAEGRPVNSTVPADYERAVRRWEQVRPHITRFDQHAAERLANGEICVAAVSSSEAFRAHERVRAAGRESEIVFIIPPEGSIAEFRFLAIPAAARRPDRAMTLFNYLLRPDVAARMTLTNGYASAIPRGTMMLPAHVRADPALAIGAATSRLYREADPSPALAGLRERFWRLVNAPVVVRGP